MLAVALALLSACSKQPLRPANVPAAAVKVTGPKGAGPWQFCEFTGSKAIRCQIFNIKGNVLYDGTFVVYSGRQPDAPGDLKISQNGGDQWIRLENGTILIPEKKQAEMTRFLDWLFGKRPTR